MDVPAHRDSFEHANGRLIVCHYPDRGETLVDVAAFLRGEGYRVAGAAGMETVDVAWTEREPA